MSEKTVLVWFRKDLRVHDNEILIEAVRKADRVIPVYCFDPRHFEQTSFQTRKTGLLRARFLVESVSGLRESLRELGGDLLVRLGKPEELLPALVEQYNVSEVYHHREVASEETRLSADVENALWRLKINLKHFIGHTLYHKEDLPFPIKNIPDIFMAFRKKVERDSLVRDCFETPQSVTLPDDLDVGNLPDLTDLGFHSDEISDNRSVLHFKGGEQAAMQRMQDFFWNTDAVRDFKLNRLKLRGLNFSTKFSPWISMGCLSPREVYWEIKKYERERGTGDFSHALYLELLSRDFYRFMFKKHGTKFFRKTGFKGSAPAESPSQQELFVLWKEGRTGWPLIDAMMYELNSTGFLSGRGRQVLAAFLVHHYQVNWLLGASWFEEKLIDYDPASNWGNWAYLAGVGTDPKVAILPDLAKLTAEIDPDGDYVKLWNTPSSNEVVLPAGL